MSSKVLYHLDPRVTGMYLGTVEAFLYFVPRGSPQCSCLGVLSRPSVPVIIGQEESEGLRSYFFLREMITQGFRALRRDDGFSLPLFLFYFTCYHLFCFLSCFFREIIAQHALKRQAMDKVRRP